MTMSANLHRPVRVEARTANGVEWLHMSDADGNYISVFMSLHEAREIEAAFSYAQPPKQETNI